MPFVRIKEKLVYFAHVPKCAGSAVESYMIDRFGQLAFVDYRFRDRPPEQRYTKRPVQHIRVDELWRLFPEGFFDHSFTVVRHPAFRLRSAYLYQHRRNDLPWRMTFERFVDFTHKREFPNGTAQSASYYAEIVPEGSRIFRLEEGLVPVISWLDQVTGQVDDAGQIEHVNELSDLPEAPANRVLRRMKRMIAPAMPDWNEEICRKIHDLFPEDYAPYGYAWDDPLTGRLKKEAQ